MRIPEKTRRQKNVSAEMQEERNFTGTDYDVYVMEKKEMGKFCSSVSWERHCAAISIFTAISQPQRRLSVLFFFCPYIRE